MKKYLVFLMAALMLVALAVAGCGGSKDEAKAQPEKVLRVATEPTFAPFEFQKEGSDELAGFDMDLIRAIGKKLGYKVEIANMGFDALICWHEHYRRKKTGRRHERPLLYFRLDCNG